MRFGTPKQRTEQARALLDFLNQSVKQEGPYSVLLKTELETLRHQADHYLYHEHLEEVNDPVYFHQFVAMAKANGLRYLGESRIGTMVTGNFGPEVEKTLRKLAPDQIQTEQYMDFLRNRMFRETLVVPEAAVPNWEIKPDTIRGLHLASSGRPTATEAVDVKSDAAVQYKTRSGMTLSTGKPLLKAAMQVFGERWPATVSFAELRREARRRLGDGNPDDPAQAEADAKALAPGLLNSYISSDLVELYAAPIAVVKEIGEKPRGLPSARVRAAAGVQSVGNRRHEVVRLTDIDQRVLPLLDGVRDRPAIIDRLTELALTGDLNVQRDNKHLSDPTDIKTALNAVIEPVLNNLASQALLVG
jgi:methyltransferase-like protein